MKATAVATAIIEYYSELFLKIRLEMTGDSLYSLYLLLAYSCPRRRSFSRTVALFCLVRLST